MDIVFEVDKKGIEEKEVLKGRRSPGKLDCFQYSCMVQIFCKTICTDLEAKVCLRASLYEYIQVVCRKGSGEHSWQVLVEF